MTPTEVDLRSAVVHDSDGNLLVEGVDDDYSFMANSIGGYDLVLNELAVDETVRVYYEGKFNLGQHENTASVTADFVVDCGDPDPVTDENKAFYFGAQGGFFTDSGLCDFDTNPNRDGDQFDLIFTPALNDGAGYYKNSGTNPGQFYVNMFVTGEAGEEVTVCVEIPDEFVLRQGLPLHKYDGADYFDDNNDGIADCFDIDASLELGAFKLGTSGDPEDPGYTGVWIEGAGDDGVYYLYSTITLDDTHDYWKAHLDWAPKDTSGYSWAANPDGTNDAVDADPNDAFDVEPILDHTDFDFSFEVIRYYENGACLPETDDLETDTIENENQFKNIKGMGAYATQRRHRGSIFQSAHPRVRYRKRRQ